MKKNPSPKSHCSPFALLAAFATLLMCSCVSLDATLGPKKAAIEKKIAQTQSAMAVMASEIALIAFRQGVGTATPQDETDLTIQTARLANATVSLGSLYGELADVNHQIERDTDATRFVNAQIADMAGAPGTAAYNRPELAPHISQALNGPPAATTVCPTPTH